MIHREDNTFVIIKDGFPYHVIEGMEEYSCLLTEYTLNPDKFTEEGSNILRERTDKEIAQEEINRLESLQTPRLMREAIAGGEYATAKLKEIDELIAVQRAIINKQDEV